MYHQKIVWVVIPAYNVASHIARVVKGIPDFVDQIVVVDDASIDETAAVVQSLNEKKVFLVHHKQNQGVGGATLTGFKIAFDQGADIVVKVDGDGQMNAAFLTHLLDPLIQEGYGYAKGNRFLHYRELEQMPRLRLIGNFLLTFLTKWASGYWKIFDPQNGYVAITRETLALLDTETVHRRYFFENDMLIHLNIHNTRVKDVPIPSTYGDETSSMNLPRVAGSFPWYLFKGFCYRLYQKHILRDFSPVALFYLLGTPLLLWGFSFGVYTWGKSFFYNQIATTGTVMLSVLPLIIGFELILQAILIEIQDTPK